MSRKKIGTYTITRKRREEDDITIDEGPIWGNTYRVDSGELWGWAFFCITEDLHEKISSIKEAFNEQQEVNMKQTHTTDYYGNDQIRLYIPRPADQMPHVLDQIPFTWYKEYTDIIVTLTVKEEIDWKNIEQQQITERL